MTPPHQPLHHASDSGSLSRAGFLLCHICYGKSPCFFSGSSERPSYSFAFYCMHGDLFYPGSIVFILLQIFHSHCNITNPFESSSYAFKYDRHHFVQHGTSVYMALAPRDKGSATADSYTTALTTVPLGCLHNDCKLAFNDLTSMNEV